MEPKETYTAKEMIAFIKKELIPEYKLRSLNRGEYSEYQRRVYSDVATLLEELMNKVK